YHMPDHPALLQSFVWQDLDLAPEFPVLRRFLDFWNRSLDGKLHSVKVASAGLILPAEFRFADASFNLHSPPRVLHERSPHRTFRPCDALPNRDNGSGP